MKPMWKSYFLNNVFYGDEWLYTYPANASRYHYDQLMRQHAPPGGFGGSGTLVP